MIDDVYEPLTRYRDEFRGKFTELTREKFKDLTARSGVDVAANRALVAEIKSLQKKVDSTSSKKTCYGWLMALGFLGAVAALVGTIASGGADSETQTLCVLGMIAGVVLGVAMISPFNTVSKLLEKFKRDISAKTGIAWKQMEPLNRL